MFIAVIGAGYWGKNLVRNFYELDVLKYVIEKNETIRNDFKSKYPKTEFIDSYEKALNDPLIHGIVIATPAETHFKFAKQSLEANKHVFVEKPLSLNVSDAETLIKLAEKKNKIIFVGHILHYHTAVIKMKELINNGLIGRIEYIYSNRLSFGKIRREENILWSFAPHDISLILDLSSEDPCYIDSIGSNFLHPQIADVTMTNLKFPSGISAHIFVSWLNPFKEQRLVVVGEKGMLVFEDTKPIDEKLTHYPHVIKWKNGIPTPEKKELNFINIKNEWIEPLKNECLSFLHTIKNNTQPISSGMEGLKVLKVLQKCQETIELKQAFKPSKSQKPYYCHESATIDDGAIIEEGTKIWHYSHVMTGSMIGKKCVIGQNVNIDKKVKVGNNVKIQNNVSLYTGLIIEDDVFLGPSCVFTNISNPRSQIKRHALYEQTVIKKGATIGANSTIVCGVQIGRYAFVAAGSVVTKDIPDYSLVMGNPAKQNGWMSRHGHKLIDPDEKGIMICPESKLKYKLVDGIMKCIDLSEQNTLPLEMQQGKISYKDLKNN